MCVEFKNPLLLHTLRYDIGISFFNLQKFKIATLDMLDEHAFAASLEDS